MNSAARRAQRKAKLRAALHDSAFICFLAVTATFAASVVGVLYWFLITLSFL